MCRGGRDDFGCPLPDFCIPLVNNGTCGGASTNNTANIPRNDWNSTEGCPMYCPQQCGAFEQECVGGLDTNGCPLPNFCAPLHFDNQTYGGSYRADDGTNGTVHCQLHCPKQCNWLNEQSCWGGLDPNGCPEPDYCMSLGYEFEGPGANGTKVFCPNYCSPMCSNDELWCSSGQDENGCYGPSYCIPKIDAQECPGFCPITTCPPGSEYVPGLPDADGCPTQGFCGFA